MRNIPGVETFLDENDIQGGDRIAERVRSETTRCDEVVILFSTASQQSDWVKAEIGAAWVLGKRIIPVVTDRRLLNTLPVDLSNVQALTTSELDQLEDVLQRAA